MVQGQTSYFGSDPNNDPVGTKTVAYFKTLFDGMNAAADKNPTVDSFRDAMRPLAENTDGFYGGSLLDADWTIIQVYNKTHFLARGFDLHKVDELAGFIEKMKNAPGPQLSEPGHGSLVQPRLIAMRYPLIKDGQMAGMVSMMIKTESYLKAVGLDRCKAFRITCLGRVTEEKGTLSKSPKTVKLTLPATEWRIEYDQ
jgi:hypothetical protein